MVAVASSACQSAETRRSVLVHEVREARGVEAHDASPADGAPDAEAVVDPRAPLLCIAAHYVGQPTVLQPGGLALELPSGVHLPYDDGRPKTTAEP